MDLNVYRLILSSFKIKNIDCHLKAIQLRDDYRNRHQSKAFKVIKLLSFLIVNKSHHYLEDNHVVIAPSFMDFYISDYYNQSKLFISETQSYCFEKRINPRLKIIDRIKLKVRFFKYLFFALFDKNINSSLIISIYNLIYSFKGMTNNCRVVIFGRLYNTQYYLAALLLSELYNFQITYIIGSSGIYANKRYTYLEKCDFICGSRVQLEEIRSLSKHGFFKFKSLVKQNNDSNSQMKRNYKFDIGFYSSGEWARINGLWRESDMEKIINGEHSGNAHYIFFENLMKKVIEEFSQKRIIVYLHPYERKLLNEYGISPPFFDYLTSKGIEIDSGLENSNLKMFECKIGIARISTIIYERLEQELDGYLYYDPNWSEKEKLINPQYLGSFSKFVYTSSDDLIMRIKLNEKQN